jgi:rhamnosyltransferase subunit B
VHHGGIGTAFQALAAGVPQLIVPIFLDQPDNGRRFSRLGVAAAVGAGTYRPREVSRKLNRLLGSDAVLARCREYGRRCREANTAEKACVALEGLFTRAGGAPAPPAACGGVS